MIEEKKELEELAYDEGVDLFGVCDLSILDDVKTMPPGLFDRYSRGISIGIDLGRGIFQNLPESRPIYARYYQLINQKIDEISFKLYKEIERRGYKAMPIPASHMLKDTEFRSFMPHKSIARASGVGWIGKSLLLVTEEYGSRVRLASILTDMELETGEPMKNRCGACKKCIENCIADALKENQFEEYPSSRKKSLDVEKCASKLREFDNDEDIGEMVCGICIKECPFSKI